MEKVERLEGEYKKVREALEFVMESWLRMLGRWFEEIL